MATARNDSEDKKARGIAAVPYENPGTAEPSASAREREYQALLGGEKKQGKFSPWASVIYGSLVKDARRKAGYVKAEDFGRAVYRRTRVYLSRDVMYKIEQGRTDPSITQFMAINLALFGAPVPSRITMACLCPEWVGIASNEGEIPSEWKAENMRTLEEQTGRTFSTPEEAAEAARDIPGVFAVIS